MDNPFLSRAERSDEEPPPSANPFVTASTGLAAVAAAAEAAPTLTRVAAASGGLVTHAVDSGFSIKIGSVWLPGCCGGESARVPIRWHVLLLAVPVLYVLYAFYHLTDGLTTIFLSLAGVPLLYLAVLVHECGHLLAAKAHGGVPSHIVLWPLGGLAVTHGPAMSLGARVRIALAGPATHVPMFAAWALLFAATGCTYTVSAIRYPDGAGYPVAACLFAGQMELNAFLLAFNLLVPCVPLDAATIIVCCLAGCGVSHARIARVLVGLSCVAVCLLLAATLVFFFSGRVDPSLPLLTLAWLAFKTWRLQRAAAGGAAALSRHPLFKTLPEPTAAAAPPAPPAAGGGGGLRLATSSARSQARALFGGGGGGGGGGEAPTAPLQAAPLAAPAGGAVWPPPGTWAADAAVGVLLGLCVTARGRELQPW